MRIPDEGDVRGPGDGGSQQQRTASFCCREDVGARGALLVQQLGQYDRDTGDGQKPDTCGGTAGVTAITVVAGPFNHLHIVLLWLLCGVPASTQYGDSIKGVVCACAYALIWGQRVMQEQGGVRQDIL